MKKILLLICVFALILTSCGKDDEDDSPMPVPDQLVGDWRYHKLFQDNVEVPLNSCDSQEIFSSSINRTHTYTNYIEADNNCEVALFRQGTWSNIGEGVYEFVEGSNTFNRLITYEGNTFFYTITYVNVTEKYVYIRE